MMVLDFSIFYSLQGKLTVTENLACQAHTNELPKVTHLRRSGGGGWDSCLIVPKPGLFHMRRASLLSLLCYVIASRGLTGALFSLVRASIMKYSAFVHRETSLWCKTQ